MTRTGSTDTKDDGRFRYWFRGRDSRSRYITPELGRRIEAGVTKVIEAFGNGFAGILDAFRDGFTSVAETFVDGLADVFERRDLEGQQLSGRNVLSHRELGGEDGRGEGKSDENEEKESHRRGLD